MANYIITDNGEGQIAVYDDKTEKFGHKNFHVYHETNRRNYPYSEFFKRVFYEDSHNIISSVAIKANNPDTDQMCFVYGTEQQSKSSTFDSTDYYKLEIKRFAYEVDENNNPNYEEYTDVYYIRKRSNERLMAGINIRVKNLKTLLPEKNKKIETIKKNINRKHKISNTTDKLITNYFDNDEEYSKDVLGTITSRELQKEFNDNRDELTEKVSRKWQVTDRIRKLDQTMMATGLLGTGIATTASSISNGSFTMNPIILGIGTIFVTHHLLKSVRMTLTDSKIGQMIDEYHKANYDILSGVRSK